MSFNVRTENPQLTDTFEVELEVLESEAENTESGEPETAALIFNKSRFVRYVDETRIIREVRDEQFAASVRARLRLGREINVPESEDGPDVVDEEFEALYREEIDKAVGQFTAEEIRTGGQQRLEAMPGRLAECIDGWRNVKVNGRLVDFDRDLCTKLLSEGKDFSFALFVMGAAQGAFVAEQAALEVAEGNSEQSSDGEPSSSPTTTPEKESTT